MNKFNLLLTILVMFLAKQTLGAKFIIKNNTDMAELVIVSYGTRALEFDIAAGGESKLIDIGSNELNYIIWGPDNLDAIRCKSAFGDDGLKLMGQRKNFFNIMPKGSFMHNFSEDKKTFGKALFESPEEGFILQAD